jgi:hypothetical protein
MSFKLYESDTARKRAYRRREGGKATRLAYKHAQANLPTQFVAIDGEGLTVDSKHLYTLLAASDGSSIANSEGLPTIECLDYLVDLKIRFPKHSFVSFYFSYDVNMMLRDLPLESIHLLSQTNECSVRSHSAQASYKLTYIPGKFFRVSKYRHTDSAKEHVATVRVWDVFGFFQGSFLKALTLYKIGSKDELRVIEKMKQKRDSFTKEEDGAVKGYNTLECDLLVRLMGKLDSCLMNAGIKLTSWLGAGAIAAKLMQTHGIKEHLCEPEGSHYLPVRSAYFGGRIQAIQLGEFGAVYAHDIVSAYPSTIVTLPSLQKMIPYHIRELSDNPLTVYHIKWNLPAGIPFTPFPFRVVDGGIHYPLQGEGYYWHCEVVTALKYYPNCIEVIEGFGFYTSEERPFEFVQGLFEARKQFKKLHDHTELVIKLGLNSLYGKTAQTVSYKGCKPPYQSFIYAGLITANTRAKLFDAAMESPSSIIAFCTDGIYSTEKLDKLSIGKDLGQWEVDSYDEFFIVKPGFYIAKREGKESSTTRGFRRSTVDFVELRRQWQDNGLAGNLTVEDSHFLGMKATKGNPDTWRSWVVSPRTLSFWPSRDIPDQTSSEPCKFRMMPVQCCEGLSLPYKWRELIENIELEQELVD